MTPSHINPGTDTTINPVVIDDSYRERKPGWNRSNAKEDSEFLSWCADRFEFHYNEDGRNPHIVRLREIASHTPAHPPEAQQPQKFNSTELLLLAHDEWKRREERKHNHEEPAWVSGFLNGFCTDKKWAREYVDALLQAGRK